MLKKLAYVIVLAMAAYGLAACADAQLTATSFGFPVIVQSSNSLAWQQDTANALDYQDASVDFSGGLPFGGVGLAFPSIHQTSLQTQSVTHTSFAQTNDFAEFAYPFESVGAAGIPGFGFF